MQAEYNTIQAGQIMFNDATIADATDVRIAPQTDELATFLRRIRPGTTIHVGGWSAEILRTTQSLSGSIITFVTVSGTGVRGALAAGNHRFTIEGKWKEQVDERARAIVDAEAVQRLNALRSRPHLVVGWGEFRDDELIPNLQPARPNVAFEPTFTESGGAAVAAGRWFLDPTIANAANVDPNPLWRAEAYFTYSNGVYVRGDVVYTPHRPGRADTLRQRRCRHSGGGHAAGRLGR